MIRMVIYGALAILSMYNGITIYRAWIDASLFDNVWFIVFLICMDNFISSYDSKKG